MCVIWQTVQALAAILGPEGAYVNYDAPAAAPAAPAGKTRGQVMADTLAVVATVLLLKRISLYVCVCVYVCVCMCVCIYI